MSGTLEVEIPRNPDGTLNHECPQCRVFFTHNPDLGDGTCPDCDHTGDWFEFATPLYRAIVHRSMAQHIQSLFGPEVRFHLTPGGDAVA